MPYTTEESGLLNNFAKEPTMYTAESPTKAQQRNYALQAAVAAVLIGALVFVAFSVSKLG